jgi:hypothetical protein
VNIKYDFAAYYDISTFGLENSTLQDMLLSFQQDLNLTESELKRANEENRRLRQVLAASRDCLTGFRAG